MAARIAPLFPEHRIYVEPFGGGGSLLFRKEPSEIEVYNDLDSGLVNLFRVLRDPEKFGRFYHYISLTPYSREEYLHCRELLDESNDEIVQAYRWYVVARSSFSGIFGSSWGYTVTKSGQGMAGSCSKWMTAIHTLPAIHERLMRVQVEHSDFRSIIKRFDTPDTLFYLDPPYIPDTRKSGGYRHEMTADDHQELVEILLSVQGKAVLSGYNHPIYKPLENAGWTRTDFQTACAAAGRTRATGIQGEGAALRMQPRTESVWAK
jgi:DNA adenine methylase